jgi:hypothetical protein
VTKQGRTVSGGLQDDGPVGSPPSPPTPAPGAELVAQPPVADELLAERSATSLADWGIGMEAALHVAYLRAVAAGFVERHTWAIRRVAEALLEHETVDGATAAEIVRDTRCVCHRRPKKKEDEPMSTPKPAPIVSTGGVQILLPKALSWDDPHARVAARGFQVGFVTLPGGFITPGLTRVHPGQLLDDRSAPARHAPKRSLRKPTKAERQARSVEVAAP